ncbi:MAG TPA: tetratricopeptide repeat protein [Thermoanaerobaculia bacterium]|nr:tetratricopeptide repeat protein [Thermoanaerobaculia bacterium]
MPVSGEAHEWIVAPSRQARLHTDGGAPELVADCHRNHRGPYTGAGELLCKVVPGAYAAAPDLTLRHALTLLSIAPELAGSIPVSEALARALSLSREGNSRLYTARLAHGVADFLLAYLARPGPPRATVSFENVHEAESLDRELIAVLLERADPAKLRITVGTASEEMDEPLQSALRAHAVVRFAAATDFALDDVERSVADLAGSFIESDCTSDDPCAKRAYEIAGADLRGALHQARLDALLALRSPTLALGALPFHCERATTPVVEPFVHAAAHCMRMAFYEASLDLARRGTRLIGGEARHPAFGELGRAIVFSLLMLGRHDEAEAYCREIESITDEPALRSHCAYAMAILHARLHPPERRDYGAARAWIERAIAFSEALPRSETTVVNIVFLRNTLALVEMRTGNPNEALRLLSDGLRRLASEAPSKYQTESIILLHNRARVHLAMDQPEGALADYGTLLSLEPSNSEAHLDRGILLQRLGHAHEALEDYDAAVLWSPPYVEAYFDRALLLRALGREDDALADLGHVLAIEPSHSAALLERAGLLYERGELADAREDVGRLLAIDPHDAKAWSLTGLLEMAARHWADARAAFDRALARDEHEHTARINRATLLVREGDVAGALRDLDAVLERRADATALANRDRLLRELSGVSAVGP